MTSILTNINAMSALQTLRSISSNMEDTQNRISSGLRVGSASDNAAYWSIATTMRSDNEALGAVSDALGLGAAKVDTAASGMESALEVVKQIKNKLVAATEDGIDKTKVQEEISQLQQQLTSISEAASFSGENWLKAEVGATTSVVASFVRNDSGAVSVQKVNYSFDATNVLFDTNAGAKSGILDKLNNIEGDGIVVNVNTAGTVSSVNVNKYTTDQVIASGATFDANGKVATGATNYVKLDDDTWVQAVDQSTVSTQEVAATGTDGTAWAINTGNTAASTNQTSVSTFSIDANTTATQLNGLISMVDDAYQSMTSAASTLGSLSSRIDLQENFVSKLTDSLDKGIGRLVDADMNEESTKLKALQTQQQLAIQALSIANSDSQNVLSLFR
ncbi:flagellin [Agrobacterium tumefaciens]|uniref:flagellin N-terminal helical domain-containing protein n=1 Tax=Agrobacterium tumefaciens TaxID=358 RepID=UPI00287D7221|nr:flagellin [Agrobacterium tumefaciens]MDS7596156.1 flagellin [Agrobacterium tumefaciens]